MKIRHLLGSACVALGLMVGAATASAATPKVTVQSTVNGFDATITYSINRAPNQIRSRSCTLAGPTPSTDCGSLIGSTKSSSAYRATFTRLAPGSYRYTTRVTLTDGGIASGSTDFTIVKGDQTISFTSTNPSPVTLTPTGPKYTPMATATSDLTVAITLAATSTGCSLSGGEVTFDGAGTCVINANQAGNTFYNAAPQVQQSISVRKADQTVSFTSANPSPVTPSGPTYTPTATATSGLTVAISIDAASDACSISAGVVTFTQEGTCVINANQSGNGVYNAAPRVQQSITVRKADQTVSFTSANPSPVTPSGPTYTPTATATSGLTVAISIDAASDACSISAGVVTFTQEGTCVINANQSGNGVYNAAPRVQQSITVEKASQSISFTSANPFLVTLPSTGANPTYTPTATSSSGLPVALSVDPASDGCTMTAGVVTFNHEGICVINADQAGNTIYKPAARKRQSIVVDVSDVAKCNDSTWQVIKDQGTGADGTVTSGDGCLAFLTGGGTLAGLRLVRTGTAIAPSYTFAARNVDGESGEGSEETCTTEGCAPSAFRFNGPVDEPFNVDGAGGVDCTLGPDDLFKERTESRQFDTRGGHSLTFSVSCSNGTHP